MISIIIPIYNSAALLPRCLDSILAQTYRDFTLILVNDGSTDGSGKICDGYAEKDERIRVIHKENGGVSSARNAGLDAADGEYITFIDSDDAIPPGYLETLYMAASGSGADVAICDVLFLSGDNARRRISCDHDFLSGPRFSAHQNGGIYLRQRFDRIKHLLHAFTVRHDRRPVLTLDKRQLPHISFRHEPLLFQTAS